MTSLAVPFAHAAPASSSRDLRISVIDVEGGAASLWVTPEGKSVLIDAGWPPRPAGRRGPDAQTRPNNATSAPIFSSADRIAKAASAMGVHKIDYLIMTHYHVDHLGGVPTLLQKLSVDTFIDHGPNRESLDEEEPRQIPVAPATIYPEWPAAYKGHKHLTVKTGQVLKIGSLKIEFVTSDEVVLPSPLPGAGQANPFCGRVPQRTRTGGSENVASLGMMITFGKSKILNLGDLTWNKEIELLCPVNKVGKADVYFVTNHGMDLSGSPPTAGVDPLVAIMQNGTMKGSDREIVNTIKTFPSLEGLWRSHASLKTADLNGDPNYCANVGDQPDEAYALDVAITPAGQITVTNTRNDFSKTYTARAARKAVR